MEKFLKQLLFKAFGVWKVDRRSQGVEPLAPTTHSTNWTTAAPWYSTVVSESLTNRFSSHWCKNSVNPILPGSSNDTNDD